VALQDYKRCQNTSSKNGEICFSLPLTTLHAKSKLSEIRLWSWKIRWVKLWLRDNNNPFSHEDQLEFNVASQDRQTTVCIHSVFGPPPYITMLLLYSLE